MKKEKINRLKAGVKTFEIAMVVVLFFTVTVSSTLIITDTGITTTDGDFVIDFADGTIRLDDSSTDSNLTLYERNGCLATKHFTTLGVDGETGYLKIAEGIVSTHNETGYLIIWANNSKLYVMNATGNSTQLNLWNQSGNDIYYDTGNVGIGTSTPKRQFDFDGGDVRTQRYVDVDSNTNLGYNSFGQGTLTGDYNTAFGFTSLYSITSGGNNHAFGGNSLYSTTTGDNNIAVGYRSGYSNTIGSHNILMGYKTGQSVTEGNRNIAIGSYNLYTTTTGSDNIIIGYDIDAPSATANNTLNIGNTIYGNLSSGTIGIGTNSPSAELEVNGYTMFGSDAPKIKMKYFTGTTDADDSTQITHGITSADTKIISVTGSIWYSAQSNFVSQGSVGANDHFGMMHGATYVYLYSVPSDLQSQTYKVLVTYQE